mgnify:CR=1 FL=1
MGLDPAQLRIHPEWLPFYRSGLRYLLLPGRYGKKDQPDPLHHNPGRETWLQHLKGLSPPYSVLITYRDLPLDGPEPTLKESGSQRCDLFRRMLSSLSWPSTSYVFWPHTYLSGREIFPGSSLFWEGIQILRPCYVLLFGYRCGSLLFPQRELHYEWFQEEGLHFLLLPDPSEMLPDNRSAKSFVWQKLRSLSIRT